MYKQSNISSHTYKKFVACKNGLESDLHNLILSYDDGVDLDFDFYAGSLWKELAKLNELVLLLDNTKPT